MEQDILPIAELVRDRCTELGLSPSAFIKRTGYASISKGLNRFHQLREGDLDSTRGLIQMLPLALDLSETTIEAAINATKDVLNAKNQAAQRVTDDAYRDAFVPHAFIITARPVPSPLFLAGLTPVMGMLIVNFPDGTNPEDYVSVAKDQVTKRLAAYPILRSLGEALGFSINFRPDYSEEYDFDCRLLKTNPYARRPGKVHFSIDGRDVSAGETTRLLNAK